MNIWKFRGWEFGFRGHLVQKEVVETDREILRYVLYVRFSRFREGGPLALAREFHWCWRGSFRGSSFLGLRVNSSMIRADYCKYFINIFVFLFNFNSLYPILNGNTSDSVCG